jgi:hypothetical protein
MLKKFDVFCESVLIEGRKSDDKKKFKVNIDKAKSHIKDIGTKHHHYIHDKGHFDALVDDLNPNDVYTPKSFIEHVKSSMKGKGKSQIADGYAKLLFTFLNDRVDSPFEEPEIESEEENEVEGKDEDGIDMDFDRPLEDHDEFA